jgi:hypothetical protein
MLDKFELSYVHVLALRRQNANTIGSYKKDGTSSRELSTIEIRKFDRRTDQPTAEIQNLSQTFI